MTDWDADDNWVDLYLRLSYDRFKDELGVERQEKDLRDYCEANQLRIRNVWVDNNKSATRDDVRRPAFEDSLTEAAARRARLGADRFTTILCWHSDRYARRVKDLLRVQDAGILIRGLHSGYFDLSNPAGVATAITVTAWAEYEGKQKATRQRAAHAQRAERGKHFWTQRPFGLEMDGTLREDEARALRQVYANLLAGGSLSAQARYLNDLGFRTSRGNEFQAEPLRDMLRRGRNAAILEYQGVEVGPGNWEPIVDEETFRSVCAILNNPARRSAGPRDGRRQNMLSNIAVCGVCEEPAVAYVNRSGKEPFKVYRCKGGGHASALMSEVDGYASALILRRLQSQDHVLRKWTGSAQEDVEAMRQELQRLVAKGADLEAALDADEMTVAQFTRLNTGNVEKISALQERISQASGASPGLRGLLSATDLEEHWKGMALEAKADVCRLFFERIEIHPRGRGVHARGNAARAMFLPRGETEPFWIGNDKEPHVVLT